MSLSNSNSTSAANTTTNVTTNVGVGVVSFSSSNTPFSASTASTNPAAQLTSRSQYAPTVAATSTTQNGFALSSTRFNQINLS